MVYPEKMRVTQVYALESLVKQGPGARFCLGWSAFYRLCLARGGERITAVGSRETWCFLPHANQSEHMPSNFVWPLSRRVFIANLKAYKKVNAGTIFSPLSLHRKIIKGKHCML